MTVYHPMAKIKDETPPFDTLFTYDGELKIEKAIKQFSIWDDAYGGRIEKAWIQVYEDGKHIKDLIFKKVWHYAETEMMEDRT